jgi:hypothetical protein
MKRVLVMAAMGLLFTVGAALAQDHWTEGPVWTVSSYRTEPGKFDEYMKYVRANAVLVLADEKKQGLILDFKFFVKVPSNPGDWDVAIATLQPSFGKAMDFNQGDADKIKAIQAKHWKTTDEDKQRDMASSRLAMRKFVGTDIVREVNLRPMP